MKNSVSINTQIFQYLDEICGQKQISKSLKTKRQLVFLNQKVKASKQGGNLCLKEEGINLTKQEEQWPHPPGQDLLV